MEKIHIIDCNENKDTRLSAWRLSSSAVLRLTKNKDMEVNEELRAYEKENGKVEPKRFRVLV